MNLAEAYKKYAHVNKFFIDACLATNFKNPQVDLISWLDRAEKNAVTTLDFLEKYEAAITKKLNKQSITFLREARDKNEYSYVGYMLVFALELVDTQEGFDKILVYVEKLANQLLAGVPAALAFAEAYENEHLALEKATAFKAESLQNHNTSAPFYFRLERDILYRQLYRDFKVATVQARRVFVEWLEVVEEPVPQPSPPMPETVSTLLYPVWTGQETDCLIRGAGDGQRDINWGNSEQRAARMWTVAGATHYLEQTVRSKDESRMLDWEAAEKFTRNLNSDFGMVFNYVAGVLCAPITSGEQRNLIGGWIDLSDVLAKIGWLSQKPDAMMKEQLRAELWGMLRYGADTKVIGKRSISYRDPNTGKTIETCIESAPWQITDEIYPLPHKAGSNVKSAPVQVHIVISQQWRPLLEDRHLAQFYPGGELLGRISPNQTSGSWARNIGMSLLRVWRIYPRETIAGKFSPTRRELLIHFAPKTKTATEILEGNDPKRAVKCYLDALKILRRLKIVAEQGDAAPDVTPDRMLKPYGRQGWQKTWLDGRSNLFPGEKLLEAVRERAEALPNSRPRNLKAKQQRTKS